MSADHKPVPAWITETYGWTSADQVDGVLLRLNAAYLRDLVSGETIPLMHRVRLALVYQNIQMVIAEAQRKVRETVSEVSCLAA